MFAAQMAKHCGINLWYPNSECVRATSADPEGPYALAEVVVPRFCHEPVVVRDGPRFRVYHVGAGAGEDPGGAHDCSAFGNGTTDCARAPGCEGAATLGQDRLGVLTAARVDGPWAQTFLDEVPTQSDANPAPFVFPNGTTLLLNRFRDPPRVGEMTIGVAVAPSPLGPFAFARQRVVEALSEDPHVWRDARGHFHALFHHNNYRGWPLAQGTSAHSRDGLDWTYSSVLAYTGVIAQTDGVVVVWDRRERPHLLLDDATGRPTHLITGVGNAVDGWTPGTDFTWTHVQPVRTAR